MPRDFLREQTCLAEELCSCSPYHPLTPQTLLTLLNLQYRLNHLNLLTPLQTLLNHLIHLQNLQNHCQTPQWLQTIKVDLEKKKILYPQKRPVLLQCLYPS